VKTTLVLLAAYAIVGTFHSCREFYQGRNFPGLHHHRWFMCGLTWMPTSIVFHVAAVRRKPAQMAQRKSQRLRDLVAVVRLDCRCRHLGYVAIPRRFPPPWSVEELPLCFSE